MSPEAPVPEPDYPWKAIYLVVAGALAFEIAAFALLAWIVR